MSKVGSMVLSVALAAALAQGTVAQPAPSSTTASVPGLRIDENVIELKATVVGVDPATRRITLKGPEGNVRTVVAGPEVRNFERIAAGDRVIVRYVEALSIELGMGGTAAVARTEGEVVDRARPGTRPGGQVVHEIRVTTTVIAVDPATRSVTLKGPDETVDVVVEDPAQFARVRAGDQVDVVHTQALAVAIQQSGK
jgi:Cu/Ag efflux protein CusF